MTEAEWLTCEDPGRMLEFLKGKVSDRKLQLFAVACCRHIWHLIADENSRGRVEVTERYIDGLADRRVWADARLVDLTPSERAAMTPTSWVAHEAVSDAFWSASSDPVGRGPWAGAEATAFHAGLAERRSTGQHDRRGRYPDILRDIIGNPFRPVACDPARLAWNGGTIPTLAQAVYEERELPSGHFDPVRLALMADMLEDAGCSDAAILEHLRGPGPHVRGCWAVDLLFGKA